MLRVCFPAPVQLRQANWHGMKPGGYTRGIFPNLILIRLSQCRALTTFLEYSVVNCKKIYHFDYGEYFGKYSYKYNNKISDTENNLTKGRH